MTQTPESTGSGARTSMSEWNDSLAGDYLWSNVNFGEAITEVMTRYSANDALASGSSSTSGAGASAMGSMNLFVNFPEAQMTTYVLIILVLITVSNIVAGKIVAGGDRYIFYFFTSMLCTITGLIYVIAPIIVQMFFTIPGMGGG